MPDFYDLRRKFFDEAHGSRYSIHMGSTRMYRDLEEVYWWDGRKRDIVEYVDKCPNCQQVKSKHQRPRGLNKVMDVPTWKWEYINLDFVVG